MAAVIFVAVASVGIFLLAFWRIGWVAILAESMATIRQGFAAMRDPALEESAREAVVQKTALRLVIISVSLLLRSLMILAAVLIVPLIADSIGVVPLTETLAFMLRWDFILITTMVIGLAYFMVGLWLR